MDNNTMREFWENQIKDANKRIAALEEDLKFNAGLLAKQCDRAMDLEAQIERCRVFLNCERIENKGQRSSLESTLKQLGGLKYENASLRKTIEIQKDDREVVEAENASLRKIVEEMSEDEEKCREILAKIVGKQSAWGDGDGVPSVSSVIEEALKEQLKQLEKLSEVVSRGTPLMWSQARYIDQVKDWERELYDCLQAIKGEE